MGVTRAVAIGWGHYLPERIVENAEFEKTLDTTDEWIRSRSGIERRRFAADGEKTSDLALPAARMALQRADLEGGDVDAIVLATSTPDQTFPSTATRVQAALGARGFAADWLPELLAIGPNRVGSGPQRSGDRGRNLLADHGLD